MISARFGWPLETDSAARAMANDSLGMGGKNRSIVANRYISRYTTGEAASARIQFSTRHLLPGRRRSTMQARDPYGSHTIADRVRVHKLRIAPSAFEHLAEPDRFFVVDANMSRRGFPASGQRRRDYLEFICGGDRRLDTKLGQEILLDTLPEQRVLD